MKKSEVICNSGGFIHWSRVHGEGNRIVYFMQGCPKRCEGCRYTQFLEDKIIYVNIRGMLARITREFFVKKLDGISISGGEPFYQPAGSALLAEHAHHVGTSVWTYTGYTYEELLEMLKEDENIDRLLKATDVLVDGPFIEELKDDNLKYRGSSNQRIIKLVDGRMSEILDYGTWDDES